MVLAIMGVISQVKVWKMVKERKSKKEEARLQDETNRDTRDARFGKAIEKKNSRSLMAWEALYGDRDSHALNADSETTASTDNLKKSTSVREREINAINPDTADLPRLLAIAGLMEPEFGEDA